MSNELLLFVSNALTGIAAWFVGRKRQQAETDNQVLRNLELSIALYKQIIDDLKDEIFIYDEEKLKKLIVNLR